MSQPSQEEEEERRGSSGDNCLSLPVLSSSSAESLPESFTPSPLDLFSWPCLWSCNVSNRPGQIQQHGLGSVCAFVLGERRMLMRLGSGNE